MKYYEVQCTITPNSEAAGDLLAALLGEIGFETFVESEAGITAYIQRDLFDSDQLQSIAETFPMPATTIDFSVIEAPDEDWNQTWEQEGFEPVIISDQLCIHDSRHTITPPYPLDIVVNPRMAFGTGTHPTTRMILSYLLQTNLTGRRIIDAGCGTGVLGILASKLGAREIVGYDIDEWSVANTQLNAELNGVEMQVLLGDSAVLCGIEPADLLIANINRNILLGDMGRFSTALAPTNAQLLLSGFYTADAPLLIEAAKNHGFIVENLQETDGWVLLHLSREFHFVAE